METLLKHHADIVEILICQGANINCLDKKERRPLHWAACNGDEDIVRLLVGAGAHLNVKDKDLFTPFHVAAVSDLMEGGASLTETNQQRRQRDQGQDDWG